MKKRYPIGINPRNLSRAERRIGRMMRAPDGHGGENSQTQNEGNPGGNEGEQNKGGQEPSPGAFWEQPKQEPGEKSEKKSEGDAGTLQAQIQTHLNSQNFGEAMNAKVMTDLADGKFEAFNAGVNQLVQKGLAESMNLTVQLLEQFGAKVLEQIDSRVNGTLKQRDDSDFLTREIPASADPLLRPMFEQVYEQALRLNNGNRALAIAKTKEVAAGFVKGSAKDVGVVLDSDRKSSEEGNPGAGINWLELAAAKS